MNARKPDIGVQLKRVKKAFHRCMRASKAGLKLSQF